MLFCLNGFIVLPFFRDGKSSKQNPNNQKRGQKTREFAYSILQISQQKSQSTSKTSQNRKKSRFSMS